jgi:hypothetical protein
MRFPMSRSVPVLLALFLATPLVAQDAAAPSGNAVKNGAFAETYDAANLWNGVDHDGFLAGPTLKAVALDDQGNLLQIPENMPVMPVGVAVGDLNGDKLPDILGTDPIGYVRIYFNEGSANEPKFGAGELSTPFLARPDGDPPWLPNFGDMKEQKAETSPFGTDYNQWLYKWALRRQFPRGSLAPGGRGLLDMWVGNYFGDIVFLRNEGSPTAPVFNQPRDFPSAVVPTSTDPNKRWGNIFSPAYGDVTGDGQPELLVGEGSYSANNVHLLANQGNADRPVFDAAKRTQIALGEGRQQLTPALADVNGDGKTDVLVSDRTGRVAVHLRPENWAAGRDFPFAGYLGGNGGLTKDFGQSLQVGDGITTLSVGDLNGDNLFDLVVGRPNGRIAWSANRGSASEPKFETPVELRSSASAPPISKLPEKWFVDAGETRGNFGGLITVVGSADDPGVGERERKVIRFGYQPLPNKIIKRPDIVFPGVQKFDLGFDETGADNIFRLGQNWEVTSPDGASRRLRGAPSNAYLLRQKIQPVAIGKTYTLSFDLKGSKVSKGRILMAWRAFEKLGERKIRGERGAVRIEKDSVSGQQVDTYDFTAGGNWSTFSKDIRIGFKDDPEANKLKATSEAILEIYCELAPPDGVLYIDNIKFEPKAE